LNDGGKEVLDELTRIRSLRSGFDSTESSTDDELESGVKKVVGIKIIHGNTLTSAVVCDHLAALLREHNSQQTDENNPEIFIGNKSFNMFKKSLGNDSKVPVLMDIILIGEAFFLLLCIYSHPF
jgi:hypothetical protein